MGRNTDWTDEERKQALDLWDDGKSATQISNAMPGRSRNAVLGLVHRAGIPQRTSSILRTPKAIRIAKPKPEPLVTTIELDTDLVPLDPPIFMLELEDAHCRWPYETNDIRGFRFCGRQKKAGMPYCECHCKKGIQPSKAYVKPMKKV